MVNAGKKSIFKRIFESLFKKKEKMKPIDELKTGALKELRKVNKEENRNKKIEKYIIVQ